MNVPRPRASLGVVRWGGMTPVESPATTTKKVGQFVDVALTVPQSVEISFYATSDLPVAGLSVRFNLQIGVGSTNHNEQFVMPVQDILGQVPVQLRRGAQRIQVSADVINILPDLRQVELAVLIAPQFIECGALR